MNTVVIDLGDKIIDFLAEKLQVEEIWSARQPRKLTWWPYRLAVTIWADPMRKDRGHFLTKISARTDVLKNVPPTDKTFAALAMLNTHAMLNRYVYDSVAMKVSSECAVYMHEGTESWLKPYFAEAVAMQAAQAHAELAHLADMFGAEADESHAPVGPRTNPDEMLEILRFISTKGDEPSPFFGQDCARIEQMARQWGLLATSGKTGATVEFEFPGGFPNSTMLKIHADVKHPKIGSGALLIMKVPILPGIQPDSELINRLNLQELREWNGVRCFGAWCCDVQAKNPDQAIAYTSFIPSTARKGGLLDNEVIMMAVRTRWLRSRFELPANVPDDTPIRLSILKALVTKFRR